MHIATLALLALGCPAQQPADTGPWDWDADGALGRADCDPHDAYVHPAATETCDGRDDDCDGEVDEGFPDSRVWYGDADGDGYGDPDVRARGCDPPSGFVADATDCDDGDPAVHPGAAEVWYDGVDQDCAGDDDDDADADGWAGEAAGGDDCDDGDAAVHPEALDPADGVDQDCDGLTDASRASATGNGFLGASAGARLGAALAPAGDHDGDGAGDWLLGAPGSGQAWLLPADPGGLLALPDGALARFEGAGAAGQAGAAVAGPGDLDGDGWDDLCVGAWLEEGRGAVGVLLGPALADRALADADVLLWGETEGDAFGYAVSGAGDTDGDGRPELLAGARNRAWAAPLAGTAFLLAGGQGLADAQARFEGVAERDFAGSAVAGPGDVDGDGLADVLVGARGEQSGGGAFLWLGPVAGVQALDAADAALRGRAPFDYAGWALSGAGDADGDGYRDLLVGAYGVDDLLHNVGAAFLVAGRDRTGWEAGVGLDDAEAIFTGAHAEELFGWAVAAPGDLDGDGRDDIAVASPWSDEGGADAGLACLFLGPVRGELSSAEADLRWVGDEGDQLGSALAAAAPGGQPSLVLGAPGHSDARAGQGAAWVLGDAP